MLGPISIMEYNRHSSIHIAKYKGEKVERKGRNAKDVPTTLS